MNTTVSTSTTAGITARIATVTRTFVLAATLGAATLSLAACGDEVKPPSQDIGVQLPEPEVRHFEPACNTRAAVRPCPGDTWPGNEAHNRKQFGDELEPRR